MEIRPLSRAEDGEAELEWVALLNSPKMNKSSTKGTSEAGTAGSISPPPSDLLFQFKKHHRNQNAVRGPDPYLMDQYCFYFPFHRWEEQFTIFSGFKVLNWVLAA